MKLAKPNRLASCLRDYFGDHLPRPRRCRARQVRAEPEHLRSRAGGSCHKLAGPPSA